MSSFVKFTCGKKKEIIKIARMGHSKKTFLAKNRLKSNQHYLEEIKLNCYNKSCGSKTKY